MMISRPRSAELEVSLFGPGYGEAVVVHLGDDQWMLVDSCLDPESRAPASLGYLRRLGIDIERAVKLVVASHWHDDHVRGISTLVRECKSAELVMSPALTQPEFLRLIALCQGASTYGDSDLDEFIRVCQILQERKIPSAYLNAPKLAGQDKLLYTSSLGSSDGSGGIKVWSLSPSDASSLRATATFSALLSAARAKKRVPPLTPNDAAVVLLIEVGHHKVLLGSDLEQTIDPGTGWTVILDHSTVKCSGADAFKVPHHGAQNAHEPRVWTDLLAPDPCALVTPFRRGSSELPAAEDVARIRRLTSRAYITAPPGVRRYRFRERLVRESLEQTAKIVRNVHSGWGQVRLRRSIFDAAPPWQVELFGDACSMDTLVTTDSKG